MKKLLLTVLLSFCALNALDDKTVPYTFNNGDTIYAAMFNANYDTLEQWIARTNDSLEVKFVRFTDVTTGDTTFTRINADTIGSNPRIDSIRGMNLLTGNPIIDSIQGLNILRGNPDADSFQIGVLSSTNRIHGNPIVDSLQGLDIMRGNPDIDSAQIGVITGANIIAGNPAIDSIKGGTTFDSIRIGSGAWVTTMATGGFVMKIYNGTDTIYNDSAYYYVFNDNVSLSTIDTVLDLTPQSEYDVTGYPAIIAPTATRTMRVLGSSTQAGGLMTGLCTTSVDFNFQIGTGGANLNYTTTASADCNIASTNFNLYKMMVSYRK